MTTKFDFAVFLGGAAPSSTCVETAKKAFYDGLPGETASSVEGLSPNFAEDLQAVWPMEPEDTTANSVAELAAAHKQWYSLMVRLQSLGPDRVPCSLFSFSLHSLFSTNILFTLFSFFFSVTA